MMNPTTNKPLVLRACGDNPRCVHPADGQCTCEGEMVSVPMTPEMQIADLALRLEVSERLKQQAWELADKQGAELLRLREKLRMREAKHAKDKD
jgi:predicted amino acid dehydrogenase